MEETNNYVEYNECPIMCNLKKSKTPLISKVPIDEFTNMVQNNFDYTFTGKSKFYPYEIPSELLGEDFHIMAIVGASGSGKSTMLNKFGEKYSFNRNEYDCSKAIVSNFENPTEASYKLSAVGLNSMPIWCRPRNVLSVGEGFRADLALNLKEYSIFDEFTSTIDRNVAKSTCNGIQKYIRKNDLKNMVFCSCHKDFIPYLKPDIVIDIDDENVYDCRGKCLGKTSLSKCIEQKTRTFGEYLNSITI